MSHIAATLCLLFPWMDFERDNEGSEKAYTVGVNLLSGDLDTRGFMYTHTAGTRSGTDQLSIKGCNLNIPSARLP